jgi:hypothetical protein
MTDTILRWTKTDDGSRYVRYDSACARYGILRDKRRTTVRYTLYRDGLYECSFLRLDSAKRCTEGIASRNDRLVRLWGGYDR